MKKAIDYLQHLKEKGEKYEDYRALYKAEVIKKAIKFYYGELSGFEPLWVDGRMNFFVSTDGLYYQNDRQRDVSELINNYIKNN